MKIQIEISWVWQSTRHNPFPKITLKCCDIKCCLRQKIAGVQQQRALSDQASDFSTLSRKLYLRTIINAIEWEGVWSPNRGISLLRQWQRKVGGIGGFPHPRTLCQVSNAELIFSEKVQFHREKKVPAFMDRLLCVLFTKGQTGQLKYWFQIKILFATNTSLLATIWEAELVSSLVCFLKTKTTLLLKGSSTKKFSIA